MPIIRSAKKKMRKDKKRTIVNAKKKSILKMLVKDMRKTPSPKLLGDVSSKLDKAVKTHLIHKNKAARIKGRLSKLMASSSTK